MGLLDYLYGRRDTGQPLLDGDASGVDSVGNPLFMDPRDAAEGKRRFLEALATMPSVQAVKEAVTAPVDAYQGKFDPLSEEGTGRALGMAGLAMTGGIAGAPKGALGSGPVRTTHELPMDEVSRLARAKEQGFTTDVFRGTNAAGGDAPRNLRVSVGDDFPVAGVSTTRDPGVADYYAAYPGRGTLSGKFLDEGNAIMPLKLRGDYPHLFDFADLYEAKTGKDFGTATDADLHAFARENNIAGIHTDENAEVRVFDPKNIRSRFAAFDPAKAESDDLLALAPKVIKRDVRGRPLEREPLSATEKPADEVLADIWALLGSGSTDRRGAAASGMALLDAEPTQPLLRTARVPTRRMTDVPNLRGLPVEEALAIARKEPHLIPSSEGTEGAYVGGPRDIQSKRGLTNMRKRVDEFVTEDPRGGDWYDRSRANIDEVTGGNRVDNEWMAREQGQWSPSAEPETELQFALKENNSALAGMPTRAGRPASHQALLRAIEENDPTYLARGDKTGEYAYKINPNNADQANTATGVNDFRHQRNLGYTNTDGSVPSSGNHLVQSTVHKFMDYETALMVDRANKANLDGRSNWTGEQIQAAPWVRQKALAIMSRNPKLTYEEAFARANTTIGDFYDKHTAFATHEAQPYSLSGHLPGSVEASAAERAEYAADPRSTWAYAPGGRDAFYAGHRLGDTGVAMRVRPTIDAQGIYQPPTGGLETNPVQVARPLVSFQTGPGGFKSLPDAEQAILQGNEALRGYIDVQGATPVHTAWTGGRAGDSPSLVIPRDGPMPLEQLLNVRDVAGRHGLGNVVDNGQGLTITSFEDAAQPLTSSAADKAAGKEIAARTRGLGKALKNEAGVTDPIARARVDSIYPGYEGTWEKGIGSGAATDKLFEHIDALPPQVQASINHNPDIAKGALDRLARDEEWAARWGVARPDIQNARRIIGDGPGFFDRLRAARRKGEVLLPSVALPLLAAVGLSTSDQGRGQ